jgi:outer membrane protein OmpA-like peptidoglycan-associated protein/Tol biopolymer transport system component
MKKIYRIVILVFYLYSFTGYVYGQFYIENEAIYNDALQFIDGEEYEEALPLLQLLESRGIINANIQYNIGNCFLNQEGVKYRSVSYLEAAAKNMSDKYQGLFSDSCAPYKTLLLLGTAYRIDNQIDKAISAFTRFIQVSNDSVLIQKATLNIRQCNVAKLMLKYPIKADIVALSQNSIYSAYNPVVCNSDSTVIYYMQNLKFYDAVVSSDLVGNHLSDPENLTPVVGSDGDLILVSGSYDNKMLIFTGYSAGKGYELYYSTKNNQGKWQKSNVFPEPINSPFNETSASLAPDGKTLYFSSNRAGGFGAGDIYKTFKIDDDKWSEPVNLGISINTSGNEISPYISADGSLLYFSSEGHQNMGGYDFFISRMNSEGAWSEPVNPGSPVSTTDNDMFICPASNGQVLYTHRNISGNDDQLLLYKIVINEPIPDYKLYLKGKLNFNDSIPAKQVVYNIVDNTTQNTREISKTDDLGNFEQLLPTGKYSLNFLYDENTTATQTVEVNPSTRIDELNIESPAWKVKINEPEFVLMIRDILFGFDSYVLPKEYMSMLDSISGILKQFDEIRLEVTGHTDSKGGKSYNLMLSEKRAQATKDYLVSKGIQSDRITVDGKGKEQPVALNKNPDGSDNALGRKFNRRVTIELRFTGQKVKILKTQLVPEELRIK